jgi:hypothetical protein
LILTPSLRLKPDIRGHVVSADEVALLGEGGKFALRGKIYAAFIPLLDGKKMMIQFLLCFLAVLPQQ